jgi:hypothetical protein
MGSGIDAIFTIAASRRRNALAVILAADAATGSLLVLDVTTRAEAEAFFANDPATKAGLRGTTSIRYLNAAILNREEQA